MAARYRKLRKIADGGMAEIFLATQHGAEGFERRVVLKQILAALLADNKFRNMLVDEAHVAMSLNHSNIVQVLDLGQSKGRYFLVLELVDGWDLNQILGRVRTSGLAVPPEIALYVVAEVCRALSYAHGQTRHGKPLGIVHRDISPHNVLLSEQGEVKLTDFGIAKALGRRERTGQGVIKGKLAFMSPEQAAGGELDARSDLFSVGTMLYLMFTGRRPFDSATDLETILRVQQCQFRPPLEVKPDLAPAIAHLIERSMKKERDERYQTGEEMLVDLEAAQRSVYRPAGQTELKRWLAELSDRDHAPPVSRAPAPPGEPEEEVMDLADEDIVFEDAVAGDTLVPTLAQAGRTASALLKAVEAARQALPSTTMAEARVATGSTSVAAPGRRRWLVAGVVTGVAATSGLLALWRMREEEMNGPVMNPAPPPKTALPALRDTRPPTETSADAPRATVAAPADAAPVAKASSPDAREAVAAKPGPVDSGAAKKDEDEEDEEALLKRREPDIAEKVIGAEEGTPARPPAAPAANKTSHPAERAAPPHAPAPPPAAQVVRIESHPDGAVVKIGSRVLGRAPLGLHFNPGITYELTFVKSGYQTLRRRFTVTTRKGQRVSVNLKRKPARRKNFFQRLFGG